MNSDTQNRRHAELKFVQGGVGHYSARYCMGCHRHVGSTLRSKGAAGIKWRCGACVESVSAKKAAE